MSGGYWESMDALDRRREITLNALFCIMVALAVAAVALAAWKLYGDATAERHVCPLCGAAHRIEAKGGAK